MNGNALTISPPQSLIPAPNNSTKQFQICIYKHIGCFSLKNELLLHVVLQLPFSSNTIC